MYNLVSLRRRPVAAQQFGPFLHGAKDSNFLRNFGAPFPDNYLK